MQPVAALPPNSFASKTTPVVKPTGFREYDARWRFPEELNLLGVQALGLGLGTMLRRSGIGDIVTGHDFRGYSAVVKHALALGLIRAGMGVHDIGLALSPMAYFAQFALDVPAVAMVTASHNGNGWTGVKMGAQRPVTFGPEDMGALRGIVLQGRGDAAPGGTYRPVAGLAARYLDDLADRPKLGRRFKVVAACGNGTAGAFAPGLLERLGWDVVPLDCVGDFTFPRYNPNPEDLQMLAAMAETVRAVEADVGLGFDGDGDRCGVVDDEGHEIFADKIGVMLARDLSPRHPGATFVVDVKSPGLFATDPVLIAQGARAEYWKTGHSYIKRRVADLGALAGFEKSGHFFFNRPIGRGYDDGLLTAIAVLEMLSRNPGKCGCGDRTFPRHGGGRRGFHRPADPRDQHRQWRSRHRRGWHLGPGARLLQQARTRGGGRNPVSEARMRAMFAAIDAVLRENSGVGAYNQTI